jgi:citrate synthase
MNYTHAEVASLDPQTMRTLCEEYLANNYIDPETSERLGVKRGLRNPDGTGVLAGLTNVCDVVGYKKDQEGHVIPIPGRLIYRGVDINEIVNEAYRNDRFVFEEVIWLLLFGSLPTQEQLDDFCELLAEHRALPDGFMDTMNAPSLILPFLYRCAGEGLIRPFPLSLSLLYFQHSYNGCPHCYSHCRPSRNTHCPPV